MGQRSQMYVIAKKDNKYYLTANYYQWNYGERMISRTRGTLEHIIDDYIRYDWQLTTETQKLRRIMDVNWDMHDIVLSSDIVKEFTDDYEEYWKTEGNTYAQDFFGFCFSGQDNNNGQMYMYIDLDIEEPKVKMCFTQYTFDEDSNVLNANDYLTLDLLYDEPGTWQEYMIKSGYYNTETILYTEKNIKYIEEHTEMLSKEELLNILKNIASQYENEYDTPSFQSNFEIMIQFKNMEEKL